MNDGQLRAAGQLLLDRLPHALIVVDHRARPIAMNARGRDALARGLQLDGGDLRNAVTAATSSTASWLSSACVLPLSLAGATVQGMVLPLRLDVDPLLMRRGFAFIAFAGDAGTVPRDLLTPMYGLTVREADLALRLLDGLSVAAAARALRITLPTARTHLRHLLEKTGTARQSALLRVLLQSTAGSIPPRGRHPNG
jgi:DNA-binding CsgD family transcriptional regulator